MVPPILTTYKSSTVHNGINKSNQRYIIKICRIKQEMNKNKRCFMHCVKNTLFKYVESKQYSIKHPQYVRNIPGNNMSSHGSFTKCFTLQPNNINNQTILHFAKVRTTFSAPLTQLNTVAPHTITHGAPSHSYTMWSLTQLHTVVPHTVTHGRLSHSCTQ